MQERPSPTIPVATLSDGESPARAFAAWSEACSPLHETAAIGPLAASATAYNLDGLIVGRVSFSAARLSRGSADRAAGRPDCICLQSYKRGFIRGHAGQHPLYAAPDRIAFQDFALPHEGRATESEVLWMAIPRHRIEAREQIRARAPAFSLPLSSTAGLMLSSALDTLWKRLPTTPHTEREAVASGFLGLVNGVLAATVGALPDTEVLLSMKRHLRARLADPMLGAEDLVTHFQRSRSTIYRLFADDGGVAAFLRRERLRRCREALVRPRAAPAPVWRVAERWGFRDPAHFTRAFRAEYGLTPSNLAAESALLSRSAADALPGCDMDEARTIRDWLRSA